MSSRKMRHWEAMGGGFPGGSREREAIIDKALKDAGHDGLLSRAEFLAILIIVGFGGVPLQSLGAGRKWHRQPGAERPIT